MSSAGGGAWQTNNLISFSTSAMHHRPSIVKTTTMVKNAQPFSFTHLWMHIWRSVCCFLTTQHQHHVQYLLKGPLQNASDVLVVVNLQSCQFI
jgi:hypothetical protein